MLVSKSACVNGKPPTDFNVLLIRLRLRSRPRKALDEVHDIKDANRHNEVSVITHVLKVTRIPKCSAGFWPLKLHQHRQHAYWMQTCFPLIGTNCDCLCCNCMSPCVETYYACALKNPVIEFWVSLQTCLTFIKGSAHIPKREENKPAA